MNIRQPIEAVVSRCLNMSFQDALQQTMLLEQQGAEPIYRLYFFDDSRETAGRVETIQAQLDRYDNANGRDVLDRLRVGAYALAVAGERPLQAVGIWRLSDQMPIATCPPLLKADRL